MEYEHRTSTVTTIKADPGYLFVCPVLPEDDKAPYAEILTQKIIAWEIVREELANSHYPPHDPLISNQVVGIGERGGRAPVYGTFVGILRCDGSCYDCEDEYETLRHMLKNWSQWDNRKEAID